MGSTPRSVEELLTEALKFSLQQSLFRISPLKSNFSAQRESEVEKKYRTGFDRSSDTEQVSNSRKSLHVGCL
jgi:hypothetical protein